MTKWRVKIVFVAVLLLFISTGLFGALFEMHARGGRVLGMGGAFTGLADDEYAILYNPAGLAGVQGVRANLNYQPVFAVDDVMSMGVIGAVGFGNFAIGGSFFQVGQDGGTSFSTVTLGGAYLFKGLKLGPLSNLRVGLNLNMYLIFVDGYESSGGEGFKDSAIAVSGGLSFLCNLFSKDLTFGFYLNNLTQPSISVFENGDGDEIKFEARVGLSYLVNEYFRINMDYAFRDYEYSTETLANLYIGAEIYFYKSVMMRFGFDEGLLAVGLGLKTKYMNLNGAVRVSGDVETYYQFDVSIKVN